MTMYRINQSHGCKPLTCDHLYGAKYGTEGTLLHVVRPQWHPLHVLCPQWHPCPRCAPTMASLSMLCAHNGCPRCTPTMAVHVVRPQWHPCPRCAPTMAVHVVRPQWHPCPRCSPTMAPLSLLCASLAHPSL